MPDFTPNHVYTCKYTDAQLKPFVDALISNSIKARILLKLYPRSKWTMDFIITSSQPIPNLIASFFSDIREHKTRLLARQFLNPRILTRLTIPRFPGIDEIQGQFLEVPSKYTQDMENAISIGKIIHPLTGEAIVDALLPIQRINQHVGILATTGAGKTNLCYQIILQLNNKIPVLVFDWKRDYRSLYKKINAKVYDFVGNNLFTFNPLKPSGYPSQWVKELANIMAEVISGGIYASGSFSVYVEILDNLYRENGVYEGSGNYPTVFNVVDALESYSQKNISDRQKNWVASASKLFKSLSIGKTREAFSVKEGISLEEILSNNVIIELDGLGDQKAKAFLIAVLLQKIRNYRLQRYERDVLKHVIIIEEAQNCLTRKNEASSTITTTYREIRGLCEGIISITQLPSELSKDALANTNTLLVMKLVHRDDKLLARNLLGIEPSNSNIIQDLDVGVCMMKADDLCLVKVPYIEREIVNDSDIRPARPVRENVSTDFAKRGDVAQRTDNFRPRDWEILKLIGESTAYNNTTLMRETNYSNAEINNITYILINKGLVRYKFVNKRGGGRKQKIYFLFPYGEEAYRQKYGQYPDRARIKLMGKYSHSAMQDNILKKINRLAMPSKRFDIRYDDKAIEIETGSSNNKQIYTNIEKSIDEFGFAYFIVSEQRMYYAVLQLCGKYQFDSKKQFNLHMSLFNDFNDEWDVFEYRDR